MYKRQDKESVLNAGSGFAGITTWDFQSKIGDLTTTDGASLGSLQFSLTNLNLSAGTADLNWTGGPAYADIALIVKAGNDFFAYFFDDLLFDPAAGTYGTSYEVRLFNSPGGPHPTASALGLSHLSVYSADTVPVVVPLPATLALLGLGALGLGFSRRRKQA